MSYDQKSEKQAESLRSIGLMVMERDSCLRGHEFESKRQILDG